jgi:DNA topoisomerase-2
LARGSPSRPCTARYIFTALEPIAAALLRAEDEPLLRLRCEEGQTIEPELFLPVLPLVLLNGAAGIGTGWMTDVPCFHPLALADAVEALIELATHGELPDAEGLDDGAADAL